MQEDLNSYINGTQLDQSSKVNQDLKSSMETKNQTNVNNTIITPPEQNQTTPGTNKKADDRPAIMKK